MACSCQACRELLLNICIALFMIILSPLLLVEILLLLFLNVRFLPPLSCMMTKSPLKGEFDASGMEDHPGIPDELLDKTDKISLNGLEWLKAKGDAAKAVKTTCDVMLAYNNVPSTEECPEDLTGVFWMDGNKIPEELACLSYASWHQHDGKFLFTKVNGDCSWTYLNSRFGKFIAWFQERKEASGMQTFIFDSEACDDGIIFSYPTFKYTKTNWLTAICQFSMERLPGEGVNYKRGCYWFSQVFGRRLEFGSYTLRKVMTKDGESVQPAFDDFVKYMSTVRAGQEMLAEAPQSELPSVLRLPRP